MPEISRYKVMDALAKINKLPGLGPDVYQQWRGSSIGTITGALQRRLILDLLGDVRGLRILDLGCGDGSLAVELHKRGAIVTGIDRSSAMVEAARAAAQNQDSDIDLVAHLRKRSRSRRPGSMSSSR